MHRHLSTGTTLVAALMQADRQTAADGIEPLRDVLKILASSEDRATRTRQGPPPLHPTEAVYSASGS